MNLVELSTRRPVAVLMFFCGVILFGLISLIRMETDLFPPLQYPEISIVTLYPFASPGEIESLITRPIEEAVSGVQGVREIRSESIESAGLVTAVFQWGTDLDLAMMRLREKVDMTRGLLPQEARRPILLRYDPASLPVLTLSATSPRHTPEEMRRIINRSVKPALERIEGVGQARISGGRAREIQVRADMGRLHSCGLDLKRLIETVRSANVNLPAGNITRENTDFLVRTVGEFSKLEDIQEVVLKTTRGTSGVRLRDIAEVRDSYRDETDAAFHNGRPSVSIAILREAGRNSVVLCRRLKDFTAELNRKYRGEILFTVIHDGSGYIENAIGSLSFAVWSGMIIAAFILFLFLRNIIFSLIVLTVIPASLCMTLLAMHIWGIHLNIMSLGGMALGVGMLVDNAIVVIESLHQRLSSGAPLEEAVITGTAAVKKSLFSSTMTTLVVFSPVIFLQGIAAALFSHLAFTVSLSLFSSFLASISLIPALFILFQRRGTGHRHFGDFIPHRKFLSFPAVVRFYTFIHMLRPLRERLAGQYHRIIRPFPLLNRRLEKILVQSLEKNIQEPLRLIFLVGGALLLGLSAFFLLGKSLLPETDPGYLLLRMTAPPGTPITETKRRLLQMDGAIARYPFVRHRIITAGYNPEEISDYFGKEKSSSTGDILISLDRSSGITTSAALQLIEASLPASGSENWEITPHEEYLSGLRLNLPRPLLRITGDNPEDCFREARALTEELGRIPEIARADMLPARDRPEIRIRVDKKKLATFGLTLKEAADYLGVAVGGEEAGKFIEADEQTPIIVRLREEDRKDFRQIPSLLVSLPGGKTVPLSCFASTEKSRGFPRILRHDQNRYFDIALTPSPGIALSGLENTVKRHLASKNITGSAQIRLVTNSCEEGSDLRNLALALLIAVLLIYMIIAAQFESLTKPLLVMMTVPLALPGITLALLLTGQTLNLMSLLGMLILAGMVVNSAIVLMESLEARISPGEDPAYAAREGVLLRLRPILMTVMTTVFGLLPMALGLLKGSEMQLPMALTLMGGLMASTFITLICLPACYVLLIRHTDVVPRAYRDRPADHDKRTEAAL